jgi:hypothetical protein
VHKIELVPYTKLEVSLKSQQSDNKRRVTTIHLLSLLKDPRDGVIIMGLTAILVGGVSGVGCHIFTNAARKIPLSRRE